VRLRVGVVGCGAISQMMHIPNLLRDRDRFELTAVCDLNPALVQAVAARHGVARATTAPEDLLAHVDAVVLATSGCHFELAEAFARAGKHVFVEKPLAYRLEEAQALEALDGASLFVGYMKRYDPAVARAKALVERMHGPLHVEVRVLHPDEALYFAHHDILRAPFAAAVDPRPSWRREARDEIGPVSDAVADCYTDVLLGSLIHDVNLVRYLVGPIAGAEHTRIARDGLEVAADVTFADRSTGHFGWFYLPTLRHYVEEVLILSDASRLELTFVSPYLRNTPTALRFEWQAGAEHVVETYGAGFDDAFTLELRRWHSAIAEGAVVVTDAADSVEDIRTLRAMARALSVPVAVSGS
jgi:predicted dehydrogenase